MVLLDQVTAILATEVPAAVAMVEVSAVAETLLAMPVGAAEQVAVGLVAAIQHKVVVAVESELLVP